MASNSLQDIPRYCIGTAGVAVSLLLMFVQGPSILLTIMGSYLLVICIIDTLYAKIPNLCNLALVLLGLTYNLYQSGVQGLWQFLLGLLVGLLLLLVPYLFGGMGGGDVKALAAMGGLLGPGMIFQVFLYIGLVGGLFAALHYLFQKNLWFKIAGGGRALLAFLATRDVHCIRPEVKENLRFPYAAAITFGYFSYVNFGEILPLMQNLLG